MASEEFSPSWLTSDRNPEVCKRPTFNKMICKRPCKYSATNNSPFLEIPSQIEFWKFILQLLYKQMSPCQAYSVTNHDMDTDGYRIYEYCTTGPSITCMRRGIQAAERLQGAAERE